MKTCYYCGTKYADEEKQCPLCGQSEVEQTKTYKEPAYTAPVEEVEEDDEVAYESRRKNKSGGKSNIVSTIICVLLALIVIAGILFILQSVGVFESAEKKPANDPSLILPVDPDEPGAGSACTDLVVTPAALDFTAAGISYNLSVSTVPQNTADKLSFASSDTNVATVSESGTVVSVGAGQATITVTCGSVTKTVSVNCEFEAVPPAPSVNLDNVSLSLTDFTLFKVGETATIRVKGLPEGAVVDVQWSIDDESIATIEDGKVTAVAKGTTNAYATIEGKKFKCIVRCSIKEESSEPVDENLLNISHEDVTLFRSGESFTIRLYKDNVRYSGVAWSSDNEAVCTVNEDGRVTATGKGTTTVRGVYEGKTYTCIVRCSFSTSTV